MRRLTLLLLLSVASCAKPAGPQATSAWTRDTVGGTANAAVFMTIRSDTPDRLVGASSSVASKTDLMTILLEGGSMETEMTYVREGIEIPAGKPVSLNPAGLHVWLDGLKAPLKAGQHFPVTLKFQKAGERRVDVTVIAPAGAPPMAGM